MVEDTESIACTGHSLISRVREKFRKRAFNKCLVCQLTVVPGRCGNGGRRK